MFKSAVRRLGYKVKYRTLKDEFLKPVLECEIKGKTYWFTVAYGGALLSEYLHLACLFGSKKNILLGSCGGLKGGGRQNDIVVPAWSYANESSAKAYDPKSKGEYRANSKLSASLRNKLKKKYKVFNGPTVTCQAMLGETWNDIQRWHRKGFHGVEMEAATVFAVSKHFGAQSAAVLRISDNLIEGETVFDSEHKKTKNMSKKVSEDMFDVALREMISA
ncbi:MAG: hypothetical protein NUV96_01220 [Candidatus Colwellbacteria bacterium]|nr:hypothetical protein [Candidatus Colwellbacteria bacterium]